MREGAGLSIDALALGLERPICDHGRCAVCGRRVAVDGPSRAP